MKKILLILLTAALMLTVAACAKKTPKDPNAVLTDSNIPLEVGAEVWEFTSEAETSAIQ